MHATDDSLDLTTPRPAPRTTTVLVFLAAFAVMASYLCIYAGTNALVSSNLLPAFPPGADPRPRWMVNTFVATFSVFAFFGLLFRWLSLRQLRRIDALAEEAESR